MKLCVCRSCSENGKITSELDKIAGQVEKQNPQLAAKIDEISDILDGVIKPEVAYIQNGKLYLHVTHPSPANGSIKSWLEGYQLQDTRKNLF